MESLLIFPNWIKPDLCLVRKKTFPNPVETQLPRNTGNKDVGSTPIKRWTHKWLKAPPPPPPWKR